MTRALHIAVTASLVFFLSAAPAAASQPSHWQNLKNDYVRGFKNIVSSPLEIPVTIREYHAGKGLPVVRHLGGAVDGTFRTLLRLTSGAWDLVAGWVPGAQDGFPVEPETLF